MRLWWLLALLLTTDGAAQPQAVPVTLSEDVAVGETFMGVRLLGALRLPSAPVAGLKPGGLSGLAWDEDEALLYAVSDDGKLFHLRPLFQDGVLHDARFVAAYRLRDGRGRPLRGLPADAEGLAISDGANGIRGDARLVVSFEAQPRIARYDPAGRWLGDLPLPTVLRNPHSYLNPNKALEAVTLHPRWGLLTAPELPLRGNPPGRLLIYHSDKAYWLYFLHRAPGSALVAMEALADGSLLTLERAFVSLTRPLAIALRRTRLPATPNGVLAVENVAVFDTSQGWFLDNFEGLTQHRDRRFFMISDDNRHLLQSTLLVYFELTAAK